MDKLLRFHHVILRALASEVHLSEPPQSADVTTVENLQIELHSPLEFDLYTETPCVRITRLTKNCHNFQTGLVGLGFCLKALKPLKALLSDALYRLLLRAHRKPSVCAESRIGYYLDLDEDTPAHFSVS